MTPKLTDEQIIKALECCSKDRALTTKDCLHECPYFNVLNCQRNCMRDALDLINRLQAENERLKETNKNMSAYVKGNNWGLVSFVEFCNNLKAEAYKEFAEKLKERSHRCFMGADKAVTVSNIDNLLKEMVGEGNNHTSKFVGAKKVMVPYLEVGIEGYDPAGKVPYLPPEAIVKHKEIIKKE